MSFRNYLINEEKSHLGHRVGDVLNSLQNIQNDMENLGSRHLARLTDDSVNQLRKVLHGNWTDKQKAYLKDIQKVAVALKRAIEERSDLRTILPAAIQSLQTTSGKMGLKVNNLSPPPTEQGEDVGPQDFQITGEPPENQQSGNDQQDPNQEPPGADAGGFDSQNKMSGNTMGTGVKL